MKTNFELSIILLLIVCLFNPIDSFSQVKSSSNPKNISDSTSVNIDPKNLPTIPVMQEDTLQNTDSIIENLGLNKDKESLARRAEIIFFASFSYLWAYQMILFDVILSSQYREGGTQGELSGANFIFSIATSILLALMVSREDSIYMQYTVYREKPFLFKDFGYPYRQSSHSWKFMMQFLNRTF